MMQGFPKGSTLQLRESAYGDETDARKGGVPMRAKGARTAEFVRDIVIGMSDGLTVPFALAAGLAGAVESSRIIVTAGCAEIAAGAIAMGLGGYLAVRSDQEYYEAELAKQRREIEVSPESGRKLVADTLTGWGIHEQHVSHAVERITRAPDRWVDFMMRHELGLEPVRPKRARNSSLTIGASYIVGGLVPLLPYVLISNPVSSLWVSVATTLVALFVFGLVKGKSLGARPWKSAVQTTIVGGIAATVAFLAARFLA